MMERKLKKVEQIRKMEIAKMKKTMSKMTLDKVRSDFEITGLKKKNIELEAKYLAISGRFTSKQLEVMVKGRTKTWWPDDDVCRSMALLIKSKSAYQFLRNTWRIPLPSISTMGAHLSRIPFTPGILYPVLNLMKYYFKDTPELAR